MKLFCLVMVTLSLGHCRSHVMVRRSDYRSPMEEKVANLTSELDNVKARLGLLETNVGQLSTQVGFTVLVSQNHVVLGHSTVKFDRPLYNQGGYYDTDTGFFTAPVAGVYFFFLSCEILSGEEMGYDVLRDGITILEVHGGKDDTSAQTASSHVVLHLTKGQRVWVRSFRKDGVARTWTSFGGALLSPDM